MIFFDVDGTLLNDEAAVRAAVAVFHARFRNDGLPADLEAFQMKWRALLEKWFDRYLHREIGMQDQRRGRVRELFPGLSDEEADRRFGVYFDAYDARFEVFQDTLPALDALGHLPLGIITNGQVVQQRSKLERTGLLDRFSVVVISEEAGAAKPRPEIFHAACRLAGVDPQACTYVGDRLETDALAARAAGWTGIWLNRSEVAPVDSPVRIIRSLLHLSTK